MSFGANTSDYDAEFFSTWLKKMDEDIATAFVLSGLSLDKNRILDAFDMACQHMHLRSLEKKKLREQLKKESQSLSPLPDSLTPDADEIEDTKDFMNRIDNLIKSVLDAGKKDKKDDDNDL